MNKTELLNELNLLKENALKFSAMEHILSIGCNKQDSLEKVYEAKVHAFEKAIELVNELTPEIKYISCSEDDDVGMMNHIGSSWDM